MALSDIRTEIQKVLGDRTDLNSQIDDQINYALQEVCTRLAFPVLQISATTTTASGQYSYGLPSDLFALWSVWDESNDDQLERADIDSFDNIDETETGTPTKYARWNNSLIIFDDVPDDNDGDNYTIGIRYWKFHPTLSDDADVHLLSVQMEKAIRMLATAYMLEVTNQEQRAAARIQNFERLMQRMDSTLGSEREHDDESRINFG